MRALFWVLIGTSAVVLAVSVVSTIVGFEPAIGSPGSRRQILIVPLLNGLAVAALVTLAALAIWLKPAITQRRNLSAREPHDLVVIGQRGPALRSNFLVMGDAGGYAGAAVPAYIVLLANEHGLEYWGRATSSPLARLPWQLVDDVAVEEVLLPRRAPAVTVSTRGSRGEVVKLHFVPSRLKWELWPEFDRKTTEKLVAAIVARRPGPPTES